MSDLEQIRIWFKKISESETRHARILRGWIIFFGIAILISIWLK